ncbi:MAG TPA: aminotransferase class I/II-fold pyridoxal phosphate-dependent enzyme, partial [Acidimicrobiia bacterium]|nr:aminotransferase class I/II-fold pyridoxal phosphate-dependent enzyme [Acidimicrobiia bacterium]
GLKCAQLIATNRADARRLRQLRVFEVPGPTPIGVAASIAAFRDGEEWLRGLVDYLDGNRTRLLECLAAELPGVQCHAPEATFLSWIDCTALGLEDPARFFLDRGQVAVSDGPPFGTGFEQFVRLNFGTSRSLLERIVGAMGDAVRGGAPAP